MCFIKNMGLCLFIRACNHIQKIEKSVFSRFGFIFYLGVAVPKSQSWNLFETSFFKFLNSRNCVLWFNLSMIILLIDFHSSQIDGVSSNYVLCNISILLFTFDDWLWGHFINDVTHIWSLPRICFSTLADLL